MKYVKQAIQDWLKVVAFISLCLLIKFILTNETGQDRAVSSESAPAVHKQSFPASKVFPPSQK